MSAVRMYASEVAIAVILLALLFTVYNPWSIAMPDYVVMSLLVGLVVLFAAFAALVWREGKGDEREIFHRDFADRVAYLAGAALLLVGIVVEELAHALDPWLIAALAAMVFGKVVALAYGKKNL